MTDTSKQRFVAMVEFQQDLRKKGIHGIAATPLLRAFDTSLKEMQAMDALNKRLDGTLDD